jgi:hypothetical protein
MDRAVMQDGPLHSLFSGVLVFSEATPFEGDF